MTSSLLSARIQEVLELQGIQTNTFLGAFDCEEVLPVLRKIGGEKSLVVFDSPESAGRAARTHQLFVFIVSLGKVRAVLHALGPEASSTVAVIGVDCKRNGDLPSISSLRSLGAMAVATEVNEELLLPLIIRGLEFRALRELELAHRCESRRLLRRERDLLGHPPETMTDDLTTFQPPPLPVGPISTYNLEQVSEDFERAYIDRVQLLCESAREAAKYLDVSAATLARRLRKEVGSES